EVTGAQVHVVGARPAGTAGELPAETGAKAFLADADRGPIQIECAVDVEGQDAAGRAVERPGGKTARKRRSHVLRHPDDLEVALALCQGGHGVGVGVEQAAADRQATAASGTTLVAAAYS